jgi:peptide/nickel transport system permease protein
MVRYILRRSLWVVFVMLMITMVTFVIFYVMPPSDPAITFAGKQPTPETVAEVRRLFGLDKPVPVQYVNFVKRLVLGDEYGWPGLGFSFQSRSPIRDEIVSRMGRTAQLGLGAAVLWLLSGVTIGVISAIRRGKPIDRAAMGFALFGVSAPVFWLGLMFLFIFWRKLGILPGTGFVPFTEDPVQWLLHMIMPWGVLALLYAASYARMMRGTMLDVMGQDYIRTARAKGLSERQVVVKHGVRASIAPIVTLFGVDLGAVLGGAIVTESVFNLNGLGVYTVQAVFRGDIPVVLAITVFAAFAIAIMSLIVDVIYAYLDPRVRYA